MSWSLLDGNGRRKYLTHIELRHFLTVAGEADSATRALCLTIALTGARISEMLALTAARIDHEGKVIVFETLKRRRTGVFRAVPVPRELITLLCLQIEKEDQPIWKISRPTAWKRVKAVMKKAAIPSYLATPRALRHTFGVEATAKRIALSLIARWLGHSRIETTAIYATPVGEEERALAALMWQNLSSGCFDGKRS
jgi:integrase